MTRTPAPALTAVLDELDEMRAKATAGGEWEQNETWTRWIDTEEGSLIAEAQSPADAALIVAAVNRLPELTAALRAVLALADELERDAGRNLARRDLASTYIGRTYRDAVDRIRAAITTALEAS